MMGQPAIRTRVLAVALVPVTLVVMLLSAVLMLGRMGDIDQAHELRAQSLIRQLVSASEYGIFSANLDSLQAVAAGALREPDVRSVQILDQRGTVLARAGHLAGAAPGEGPGGGRQAPGPVERLVQPVLAGQVRLDDPLSGVARAPAQPAVLGHVVLEMSRETLSTRERDMLLIGLAVTLGGILLGGFLALRLRSCLKKYQMEPINEVHQPPRRRKRCTPPT